MLDQAGVCRVTGRPASHRGVPNGGKIMGLDSVDAGDVLGLVLRGFPRVRAMVLSCLGGQIPKLKDIEAQPPVPTFRTVPSGSRELRDGYKPGLFFPSSISL